MVKYLRRTLRLSLLGVAGLSSLLACNALFGIDPPVRVDDLDGRGGANGEDGCLLPSDCVEQGENYVCLFRVCSPPCVDDLDCTTSLGQGHRCLDTDEGAACVSTAQA